MPDSFLPFPHMTAENLPRIIERDDDGNPIPPPVCPCCQGEYDADDAREVDGESVCPDCCHECEECGHVTTDDTAIVEAADFGYGSHRRTRLLCEDCRFTCADCGEEFDAGCEDYRNTANRRICGHCSEDYYTCDDCGELLHRDNTYNDDYGTYCQSCYDDRQGEDDEDDGRAIHEYGYKPAPVFFVRNREGIARTTTYPGDRLYLGIELEVDHKHGDNDCADDVRETGLDCHEALYCKSDGSLNNGFEIVSHPGTWEYWRRFDWRFTDELKRRGYRSYNTDTCGMHVHVSKAALSELDRFKLLQFFRDNAALVTRLSRRVRSNLDRWARIEDGGTRSIVYKVKHGPSQRYEAINLTPAKTVEFRIFRGTLDAKAILRNLALVVALCKFVQWAGMHQLTETWFCVWLRQHGQSVGKAESRELLQWVKGNVADEQAA